ncbi:Uncharacterized protein APZ42_024589 [Daphnia magna]|uniref:Uncharacterized protein n=1 Tax=Daphnia magna TaxID=35525 RepID=A0A0P5FUG0_9CRUS|nr:Uncharacterized protein APZ42_024589 [Daphnia magna]
MFASQSYTRPGIEYYTTKPEYCITTCITLKYYSTKLQSTILFQDATPSLSHLTRSCVT